MNLSHYLTFLRIIIVPFFPLIYLKPGWFGIGNLAIPFILIFILILCELTDLFDGFLARKRNEESDIGKVLDPMADSITRLTILFTFTQGVISAPLLLILIFLYREFIISTLRTICAMKGFALAARKSGKIKAIIQAVVNFLIVILLIPYYLNHFSLVALRSISHFAILIAALYSVASAVEYIYVNRGYIKKVFSFIIICYI